MGTFFLGSRLYIFSIFFLNEICNVLFLVCGGVYVCVFLFCHTGSIWKFVGQGSNHTAATRATAGECRSLNLLGHRRTPIFFYKEILFNDKEHMACYVHFSKCDKK